MSMTELEKRAAQMKWDPPPPGSDERDKMPRSAFLSPSTRTFPYKVEIDGQWVVSVKGLRSAISVANFRGNPGISARASKLLEALLSDEVEHSNGVDATLAHFGVLGMKWGVRRTPEQLGRREERKLKKEATKAAERSAVAKTAYGKGAGIQRRLVKTELEQKLKNPVYKKYFDEAMANQNKEKIVNKAVANSRGRAAREQSARTAKMVAKTLTGTTSLAAAFIFYKNNSEMINSFVSKAIKVAKRG